MNTAVLTGGTGFLGYWVLKELLKNDIFVYVVVRKNSKRLERLNNLSNIKIIELNMEEIDQLKDYVGYADVFYHLAWEGERNDFNAQMKNVDYSVKAMQVAKQLNVKQFIVTGSQAEYGICHDVITEDTPTNPNTAYGACKLACYNILSVLSNHLDIGLTWARVFSVYGGGDNPNTLISYLEKCFKNNINPELTTGKQIWNFLHAKDAANALFLLGNTNTIGVFNLASEDNRELKEYIEEMKTIYETNVELLFTRYQQDIIVNLNVNVEKIKKELNWKPEITFKQGILNI